MAPDLGLYLFAQASNVWTRRLSAMTCRRMNQYRQSSCESPHWYYRYYQQMHGAFFSPMDHHFRLQCYLGFPICFWPSLRTVIIIFGTRVTERFDYYLPIYSAILTAAITRWLTTACSTTANGAIRRTRSWLARVHAPSGDVNCND